MTMMNKPMSHAEDRLEDALALLAAGVSLADILAEAGDDAEWLRPSLELALEVGELQAAIAVPSPEASLQRMLAYGQELAATAPPAASRSGRPSLWAGFFGGAWLPRLATGLVSALLLMVLLGGTLTVLAQRSLPGQPLYSLKRAGETVRLNLTFDTERRSQLLENFNQQRQTEARLLLEQNLVAAVNFSGQLDTLTATSLTLDGLALQLTPQTKITGNLAAGARIEVEALTQPPDRLIALAVTVIEPAPPTPAPLPTPLPTVTPTATATRSLSSATDTLQLPTVTPLPTATPTIPPPPPTATPLPPTATSPASPLIPTSETGNDNSNENGSQGPGDGDNTNDENGQANDNDNGSDDSGGDNSGSGSDNSGSGSDNSGGGGGDDHSGSDNSGHGGGDDNSGSGSGKDD